MRFRLLLLSFLYLAFELAHCNGISTMAVDLGREFTKVAVVSPGIPMDIALDGTSDRKFRTLIFLRKDLRLFGNAAISSSIRDPTASFESLPSILGKPINHRDVKMYQQRFYYHNLTVNEENGLLAFNVDGRLITVEELLAMFLEYVRTVAEDFSSSKMTTAVLTIPPYCTQAERRAWIRVGNLAGLDVKQLVNDVSAVVLNYGLFRRSTFDTNPRHYLFIDVGASATRAAVVSYQVTSSREGQLMVQSPHAFIKGVGADPTLGTNAFIDHLLHYVIERFKATKRKTKQDFQLSARVWKRLESKVKEIFKILSANSDVHFTLEDLLDNNDYSLKVTRRELEDVCVNLTAHIAKPLLTALQASSIPMSEIKEVILFGGGTRVPMIQEALRQVIGKSVLGKSINADEAVALGAVFQAARRTAGFRVPLFVLKDLNFYPILVTFPRVALDINAEAQQESLNASRTLFPSAVMFPQGRSITFKSVQSPFRFLVHYANSVNGMTSYLDGVVNLLNITIHDATEKLETFKDYVARGVKAHFALDENGLLNLTEVNLILEPANDTKVSPVGDSAFKKITDGISSLFGGGDSPAVADSDSPSNVSEPIKAPSPSNETTSSNATGAPATPAAKKQVLLESLRFDVEYLDALTPTNEQMASSRNLLDELNSVDNARRHRQHTQNKLESNLYQYRDMLNSEPHTKYCSTTQREAIETVLKSVAEWYEENGDTATSEELEEHVLKVEGAVFTLVKRVDEFKNITLSLDRLSNIMVDVDRMLEIMKIFQIQTPPFNTSSDLNTSEASADADSTVDDAKNQTSSPYLQVFNKMEITFYSSLVKTTKNWMEESTAALEKADLTTDPPFRESDVQLRLLQMEEQLHFFSTKLDNWRRAAEAAEAARKAKAEQTTTTEALNATTVSPPVEILTPSENISEISPPVEILTPSENISETTPRAEL